MLARVETIALPKTAERRSFLEARSLWRRYCYILLMAAWMGGFTFYALIVIPTAERVLASMRDTGFITQQVTRWLNLIGAGVLLVIPWLVSGGWTKQPPRIRFGLAATWVIMAVTQAALFLTHPMIDRLLEVQGHKLHNFDEFDTLHTIYLSFATAQWVAALLQIWLMLMLWRRQDASV